MMNGHMTNVLPNSSLVYFEVGPLNVQVLHSPGQTIAVHTQLPHAHTQRLHSTWVSAPSSYVSSSKAHSAGVTVERTHKHTCTAFLHTGMYLHPGVCAESDVCVERVTLGVSALQSRLASSARL